ncbi:MAG: putative glycoside hydrolase [Campylobacterota bacterium]|nr:putative glycoside hydrolase [Campylobacterota bacterium]
MKIILILFFFTTLSLYALDHNQTNGILSAGKADDANATVSKKQAPDKIKALYINFAAANPNSKSFKNILKKIETTEINAIVVDIKNVKGNISYRTDVEKANQVSASKHRTIKDIHHFLAELKSRDIYSIARICVFKDTRQARHFPHRAIKTSRGAVWKDKHNTAWVDPYRKESQDYTLAIAEDAAKAGFDEINFDYIRFPAKVGLRYTKKNTQENRIAAIESFLKRAQDQLKPYGTLISVDIFGYVAWNKTDTHIGQTVASLAKYSDYICPMLYPSGFYRGTLGYKDPTRHPYTIVKASILKAHSDVEPAQVRPWLQSFRDYAFARVNYTEYHIAQQILAADDTNTSGWMLWNPSSRYPYVNKTLFYKVENRSKIQKRAKSKKRTKRKKARRVKKRIKKTPAKSQKQADNLSEF